jgi:nucleoside permease NupC
VSSSISGTSVGPSGSGATGGGASEASQIIWSIHRERSTCQTFAGSEFVFGELGKRGSQLGFYFAFQILPTVIFIAAFFSVLYHYGVMQFIIRQLARVMTRFMGASGAESLNVAASIFMGQTDAPLTIRPFCLTSRVPN